MRILANLTIAGTLDIDTVLNANADTDRFLVQESGGLVRFRTGAEVLSDIGAQGVLTLTTTGTSGPATLIGNTLNIPQYEAEGNYVTTSTTLTINGVTYDLSANRSWSVGTVTSVGLTMPSAFSVANSPVTGAGTISVTGAGTAAQYIRGDGALATFPSNAGGGSSVNYYLNGSISSTVSGYQQMDYTAIVGSGTDLSLTGNGLVAQFLTDIGNPNRILIPGGAWNLEMFFSVSSAGGNQKFYVDLLKYNGSTFTLIASTSTNPEEITGGTATDLYLTSIAVPETVLLTTDRLAIRVYIVDNAVGRTVTLHTEDNNLCQIVTTFAGGIASLNGLTANTQYLATGTSGTDFNIVSLNDTHTFNLPTASATNRGALSSADWTTFNGKIGGTGTTNYLPKFTGASTLGNSIVQDSGGILSVAGRLSATGIDFHSLIVPDGSAQLKLERIGTSTGSMYIGADNVGFKIFDSSFNTRLTLTSGGNLGLGVTPSAWASSLGFDIYNGGSLFSFTNNAGISSNAYFNGTNWIYKNSSVIATKYETNAGASGSHSWYNAVSGTAGGIIAFTQPMTLNASGNLLIATTTDNLSGAKLQVTGAATFSSSVTASSLIKSGGTSAQFLKADGSVDSNTYVTGGPYLPLAGGTMSGGITFSAATTYTPLRFTGGVADYTVAEQDGAGRVNWYWNKSGTGGAPTYQVSAEDAVRLKFSTSQAAGTEAGIGVYYALAGTAGGAITWVEAMGAFHNAFRVLPAATFTSSVTASSFIKSGGTATQILAANGSVITAGTNITISGGTISATDTGITSLNGLTALSQTFAVGTSGTDFAISSATSTHTFNLPTASATNRGALSSADWTTFNGKFNLPSLTAGSVLFSNGTTIAQDNANLFWDDTNNRLGIGTVSPNNKLTIFNGSIEFLADAAGSGYGTLLAVPFDGGDAYDFTISTRKNTAVWSERLRILADNGNLIIDTNTLFVDAANNRVGVGTVSPTRKVTISEGTGTNTNAYLSFNNSTERWVIGNEGAFPSATNDFFFYDTAYRLVIKQGGNVGIGTTSPGNKLAILSADLGAAPTLGTNQGHFGIFNGTGAGSYGLLGGIINNGNAYLQVQRIDGTATAYNMLLQPSGGNVLVGTATDNLLGDRLQVNGSGVFTDNISIVKSGNALLRVHSSTNTTPVVDIEMMRGTNTTWGADAYGDYRFRNSVGNLTIDYGDTGVTTTRLTIASTGAATFSSSVTATNGYLGGGGYFTTQGQANNTPSAPSANIGVFIDTYAFIDLATQNVEGSWIDFSKGNGVDYGGRIRYQNSSDSLRFFTNNSSTACLTLDSTGAATFSSSVAAGGNISYPSGSAIYPRTTSVGDWFLLKHNASLDRIENALGTNKDFTIGNFNGSTYTANIILNGSGAATFSSSVTASTGYYLKHSNGTTIAAIEQFSAAQGAGLSLYNSSGTQNVLFNAGGDSFIRGGNVGIGTNNPFASLTVLNKTANTWNTALFANSGYVHSSAGSGLYIGQGASTGNTWSQIEAVGAGGNNYQNLALQPSGGNILVGTTTDAGYKLDVNGTGRISGGILSSGNIEIDATNKGLVLSKINVGPKNAIVTDANGDLLFNSSSSGFNNLRFTGAATFSSTLTMGTTAATNQYIRMGLYPNGITNSGEAWIGRASDRNAGTMTVQLGGGLATSRSFEVVDYAWTTVLFSVSSAGVGTFSSSVTASSLIKSGGTSAQILAADGSVITAGTNITISGGTISASASGITSLNALTAATQTFAVGSSGTDFNISSATSTHTFNIPDAGGGVRGLVTITDQTFGGVKRFANGIITENTGSALTMYYGSGGGLFEYRSSIRTLSDGAMQLFAQSTLQYERIILGMNGATVAGNVLIGKTTDDFGKLQVAGSISATNLILGAGTTSTAPLDFTLTSAALKTTPLAGDMEVNASGYLFYTQSARRGILSPVQWIANTATRTFVANTNSQNMFDTASAGANTFTAVANTTYIFEVQINLTNLSATANSVGFGLSLTGAVASNISYMAISERVTTIGTPTAPTMCRIAVTATTAVTSSVASATSAAITIKGIVRFTTGGSVIPVISQIGATSASVLGIGSYVKFQALGTDTETKNPSNGWA